MKRSDTKLHRLKEVAEVELNTTQDSKVLPVSPSAPSTLTTSRLASFPEAERELVSTALRVCKISVGLSFQPEEERGLLLQAFEICIRNGDETLACALVPGLHCEVPVYLVHRAGEQGLVRVLKTLLDCQVPLKAPRCLVNIPVKMLPAARRKDSSLRLFSNSKRVTSNDLLRWACLTGKKELVM